MGLFDALAEEFIGKMGGGGQNPLLNTGENQPISGDQIENVLGPDRIKNLADQAGVSREEATGGLASLLPQIIDKLTPNGKVESGLLDEAMKMFKGKTGF